MKLFEAKLDWGNEEVITYNARIGGYPVSVERQSDWVTAANWTLPAGQTLEDFLRILELVYEEAETNGCVHQSDQEMVVGFNDEEEAEYEYYRPLLVSDLGLEGHSPDDVSFLQVGGDMGRFVIEPQEGTVGTIFEERPHQVRGACRFMAELIPVQPRLKPADIGKYLLQLPRPAYSLHD